MERTQACSICGNHHSGDCSYEITYFEWKPEDSEKTPQNVEIVGQWYRWQNHQTMAKEIDMWGNTYFYIYINIPVGYYEYKYLVDGVWQYNKYALTTPDPYGSLNNYVQILPKKALLEYIPKQDTKIASSLGMKGLKIIGSWDNWQSETVMELTYNNLKGYDQNYIYLELVPNVAYEFKFKLRNQYLIDQKYPTVPNEFGGFNNKILVCKELMSTPTGWRTNKQVNSPITCKYFEWNRININPELSIYKVSVEGHSICQLGESIYIFGGKIWGDYTNCLTKANIHRLSHLQTEEILPEERAYHCAESYGNKMIIYGGHNLQILQDYNVFNTTENIWIPSHEIRGKFPSKREKQSCVLYQMLLVFFGGYYCSPDFEFEQNFNDIQVLDIEQMKWIGQQMIKVLQPRPEARYSHTATLIHSEMFVFGGTSTSSDQNDNQNYNDLWMLNLQKVSELKWQKIKSKGKPPAPRHGHSCNNLNNYLIIFGGLGDKQQLFNDITVFNRQTKEWVHPLIRFKNSEQEPIPRAFHASTTINNEYIIIFGGKTKANKTQSFYVLKPIDLNPSLDIEEEDSEEDNKSEQALGHSHKTQMLKDSQ